jgi:hypothetical protein
VYAGDKIIYYPDFAALRAVYTTLQWPQSYRLYHTIPSGGGDDLIMPDAAPEMVADDLFNGTINWKHINRNDLQQYATRIDAARAALLNDWQFFYMASGVETGEDRISVEPTERKIEALGQADDEEGRARITINKLPNLARSRSVGAMLHFSSSNWPADFLQAYGITESHAGTSIAWSVVVPTRKLFVLVAVVENLGGSGATFSLPGFNLKQSERTDLRRLSDESGDSPMRLPFPLGTIGRGDRIVIPLQMELRKSTDVGGIAGWDISPSAQRTQQVNAELGRYRDDQIFKTEDGPHPIRKSKRSFVPVEEPSIVSPYIYGRRYTFESMIVDNRTIPVRQLDPNKVTMIAGFDGGSCPILYVSREGSSEPIRVGTILRAARGSEAVQTEEIDLGSDPVGFRIAEEEPERTTITEISLVETSSNGDTKRVFRRRGPFIIQAGEGLSVTFDPGLPAGKRYRLQVSGYYETYGELLTSLQR